MIGELATWYLFLAGAGAGALLVTAVLEALTPFEVRCCEAVGPADAAVRNGFARIASRVAMPAAPRAPFPQFFGPAYGVGLIAVVVGALCLLADLGRPDRLLRLLFAPTLSFISVGVWLLMALGLCAGLLCAIWCYGASHLPRGLVAAARTGCALCAVAVMTYTGLLLASMQAVPFWHSAWLPLLFIASDISTGIGLVVAAVVLCGDGPFRTTLLRIKQWDALAIAIEAACLILLLLSAYFQGTTARESATMLLSGSVAPQFWIMVVATGLVFPFLAERLGRLGSQRMMLSVSAALLISCFFLRWCVVQVGMAPDVAAAVMVALGAG
ncbi:NrfD/PsrC family molybdoenzyme membrane anchor subunit [Parvibacter caecicola]|uniref:Formate-dependent nitrite reductase membrane component NrfD n=1 Tax=Parvibacter caecicola TaxID=747645 RepID=A0A7W5D488_9ACTN|nr:NrfD/PsrC family molybdoenzyme membrane anchor subunit [Parvibacter caecicola]MBB3171895.1 formate-dependent nitrite reductase membrane component NrfD [Parvibacter caecicola]MCR2040981.1 polysulfide reductase NrfD [Parvibacter caecicola]RNL09771.1 hypothetical protein DMP11_08295 [Parvibacter caecicola]